MRATTRSCASSTWSCQLCHLPQTTTQHTVAAAGLSGQLLCCPAAAILEGPAAAVRLWMSGGGTGLRPTDKRAVGSRQSLSGRLPAHTFSSSRCNLRPVVLTLLLLPSTQGSGCCCTTAAASARRLCLQAPTLRYHSCSRELAHHLSRPCRRPFSPTCCSFRLTT